MDTYINKVLDEMPEIPLNNLPINDWLNGNVTYGEYYHQYTDIGGVTNIFYCYRDRSGCLFSTSACSLVEAKNKRNLWLKNKFIRQCTTYNTLVLSKFNNFEKLPDEFIFKLSEKYVEALGLNRQEVMAEIDTIVKTGIKSNYNVVKINELHYIFKKKSVWFRQPMNGGRSFLND